MDRHVLAWLSDLRLMKAQLAMAALLTAVVTLASSPRSHRRNSARTSAASATFSGEKWGAGPTAVLLRQDHGWTYTTKTATTFGVNTESTYDWENEQWTVPVNVFVTQLLKLGPLPISLSLDGRDYAERPIGGPDWGLRFAITFLFPR